MFLSLCLGRLKLFQSFKRVPSPDRAFPEWRASLVAITPEKPELTAMTGSQRKLEFPILPNRDNQLAKKFGLVFGIDLESSQENREWSLPVPATYVVLPSGRIQFAFVDVDYTRRAEPSAILDALRPVSTERVRMIRNRFSSSIPDCRSEFPNARRT